MSDADDTGAHHGVPILTRRDLFICQSLIKWVQTARAADNICYGPDWLPNRVDIAKSRLFWRIRSGKEPLPEAPPRAYSCPWYELVEEPERPHWVSEVWTDGEICSIAQCRYDVEKWSDDRKPEIVKFRSYRFKVWEGDSYDSPSLGKMAPHGWWIQRLVGDEQAGNPLRP